MKQAFCGAERVASVSEKKAGIQFQTAQQLVSRETKRVLALLTSQAILPVLISARKRKRNQKPCEFKKLQANNLRVGKDNANHLVCSVVA